MSVMFFSTSIKRSSEAFPEAGSSSDRCIMDTRRSCLGRGGGLEVSMG